MRQELSKNGLHIKHWGSVNCVQTLHGQRAPFLVEQFHNGEANLVRTVATTLRKNADFRPHRVVAWVAATATDGILVHLMHVRVFPSVRTIRYRSTNLQKCSVGVIWWRLHLPMVIYGIGSFALDDAYRLKLYHDNSCRLLCVS